MKRQTMAAKLIVTMALLCLGLIEQTGLGQVEAVTKARHDLKLGFTVGGKVTRVLVKPGDQVKKDQLLMELDDEEGKSLVSLYQIRTSSDLEFKSAQAGLQLAKVEENAIRKAFENDAAKPIEVERAQINATKAALELGMTRQRHEEAKHQLQQAKSRHSQYLLKATTDGVIDFVSVAEGELVETLKPVLRLVVIDPLWIDAAVPTQQTLGLKAGDQAEVKMHLPGYEKPIRGTIIHLAQVADAASDTRLVRIEVPNPSRLPAGGQVTVYFKPTSRTASGEYPPNRVPRGGY